MNNVYCDNPKSMIAAHAVIARFCYFVGTYTKEDA
jgi:hypothetical protein